MAGNLSVSVTADVADLQSRLAIAQAEIKQFSAAARAAAAEIATSGSATAAMAASLDKANTGLRTAQAAAAGFRAEMLQGAAATKTETVALTEATGAVHSHRAATEAMVLVHEAMSGRFSKMGGSLMILTQQLGGASMAMMGLAGAFAVAAMGAMHLVEWLDKVHNAKLLSEAGAIGSGLTRQQADEAEEALRSLSGVTADEAGKIAHAYTSMRGVTQPVLTELEQVTRQFALRAGEDTTAAAQKIVAAYGLDAAAATEVMEKTRATTETTKALQDAITNNQPIQARTLLLRELARSAHDVDTQTRAAAESAVTLAGNSAARVSGAMLGQHGGALGAGSGGMFPPDAVQNIPRAAEMQASAEQAQRLDAAIRSLNAEMKAPAAVSWSEQMHTSLAAATLATVEAGQHQKETWQQINLDKLKTEVNFWQKAVQTTREGSKEQEEAKRALYQAEEQLDMMTQKSGVAAAKQTLEAKLAELSQEQSAQHANFAAVMDLEQQKLNLLKAAGAAYTKQYQEELKHQEDMQRQHNDELQRIDLEHLVKTESIDREALSTKKSELDAEVADHQITKQAELSQLLAYVEQQYQAERSALQNFIDTNTLEVGARQKALDQMAMLEGQHAKEVAALDAQMAQANQRTAEANEREWVQAFSSIGSAGERAVSGLVMGTETYRRAEMQVAQSVVESAISMGTKLVEQWLATELAKTEITGSSQATRNAVQVAQDAGATGMEALLSHWLGLEAAKDTATAAGAGTRAATEQGASVTSGALITGHWVATEAAKTGTTATGAATRAATDSGSGFLSAIGSMIARWLGLETAKTAGTSAGAANRAAVEGTAAVASLQVIGAAARLEIATAAAVAGAWAFADSAMLGPPGLAAAPAAAAGATATVMAFQAAVPALAVGAWDVPSDMLAQIHQGEMVVPATFAAGMRNAASTGGGSSSPSGGDSGGGAPTTVNFSISAIDSQSVQSFLRSNGASIAQIVAAQQSRNPSLRANY